MYLHLADWVSVIIGITTWVIVTVLTFFYLKYTGKIEAYINRMPNRCKAKLLYIPYYIFIMAVSVVIGTLYGGSLVGAYIVPLTEKKPIYWAVFGVQQATVLSVSLKSTINFVSVKNNRVIHLY